MYLFTIIVPAYNSAKTIKQCVDSVLGQTYHNFELIIINDGSSDDTLDVVKKINDSRIKIISQENSGPFIARKRGIIESKGDYVLFLDSDDYFCLNALETLNNILMEEAFDLIKFNYEVNGKNSNLIMNKYIVRENKKEIYRELIYSHKLNNLWNECVSKKVLNKIRIPDLKIMQGEDAYLNFDIFTQSQSILFIPNVLYKYSINLDSTTNNTNYNRIIKSCNDVLVVYEYLLEKVEEWDLSSIKTKSDISTKFLIFISHQVLRLLKDSDIDKYTFNEFLSDYVNKSRYKKIVGNNKVNYKLLSDNKVIHKMIIKKICYNKFYEIYKYKKIFKILKKIKTIWK